MTILITYCTYGTEFTFYVSNFENFIHTKAIYATKSYKLNKTQEFK